MAGGLGCAQGLVASLDGITDPPVAIAAAELSDGSIETAFANADASSRFEFGSIGKTMTAQILAALVLDGRATLESPIGTWLDAGPNGEITVGALATHTSGLTRMADNAYGAPEFDYENLYARYTAEMAEAALRVAPRSVDEPYSNFGYQLLGVALERIADAPFADLLATYVFEPFGLANAMASVGPNQVQGYANGHPVGAWTILLGGPGGVTGTIGDLAAWGAALLEPPAGAAGDALLFALSHQLGWSFLDGGIVWHNGGTAGGHACVATNPTQRRGCAVLIATSDIEHVDHAALYACQGRDPLEARPEPAGDEHNNAALKLLSLLFEERWDDGRRMMSESCADALTAERLAQAWAQVMTPRGPGVRPHVKGAARRGSMISVSIELRFADETGSAEIAFDEAGNVVGLHIN